MQELSSILFNKPASRASESTNSSVTSLNDISLQGITAAFETIIPGPRRFAAQDKRPRCAVAALL
jgi:hypothetical protein